MNKQIKQKEIIDQLVKIKDNNSELFNQNDKFAETFNSFLNILTCIQGEECLNLSRQQNSQVNTVTVHGSCSKEILSRTLFMFCPDIQNVIGVCILDEINIIHEDEYPDALFICCSEEEYMTYVDSNGDTLPLNLDNRRKYSYEEIIIFLNAHQDCNNGGKE